MSNPNTPIVNAGTQYIYGFQMAKSGNKTLTLFGGEARSSANTNDIVIGDDFKTVALTLSGTFVGPNGMGRAVMALNTSYYVFIIGDSTGNHAPAGLIDTFQYAPQLPVGYDIFRRIGFIRTDGSANILSFYQNGTGVERTYFYDVPIAVLTGGTATSFTAVTLGTALPQNAYSSLVYLDVAYTPNSATNLAEFLPGGSSASNGNVRFGSGVAGVQVGQVTVSARSITGVTQFLYKVAASDALTLSVSGYVDSLAE